MSEHADPREPLLRRLAHNPLLAHRTLFKHRHPDATQPFHDELILDWHSDEKYLVDLVFRGGAKSTTAEEAICTMACFQKFHNALIIGETVERARERLASIKHEFETNEDIMALFGDVRGDTWQETRVTLASGICLQAVGSGQSLRGAKHLQYRPDIVFCDDLEDEESVRDDKQRDAKLQWFLKTLLPALDPHHRRIRLAATPLHPDALAMKLCRLQGWKSKKFPISHIDPDSGEEKATWPDRFPMTWIVEERDKYAALGAMQSWRQEYMCEVENPEDKIFTPDMMRCEATVRAWQPTYAVYDPARTVKQTSATTGKVVGSWVNNKLILWEADAKLWRPDEIIEDIFRTDERYSPIVIGVEEDGLHEFIMQPLRHAQIGKGHALPIRALKAPKGKLDFIRSLQPFFKAGEIIFAGERSSFAELERQLLGFPTGRIDAPNALAYFLRLRPGLPIFDFSVQNVADNLKPSTRHPFYLCLNATSATTTAILVQIYDGILFVLADFVREGDPGMSLTDIVREVGPLTSKPFTCIAGPKHFQAYDNIGLRAAARKVPVEIRMGAQEGVGREEIRTMLRRLSKGQVAVRISTAADWTLRAFSGGYARDVGKQEAVDGVYRTLCEGLESFAGTLQSGLSDDPLDNSLNYAHTGDGRRYISARAKP